MVVAFRLWRLGLLAEAAPLDDRLVTQRIELPAPAEDLVLNRIHDVLVLSCGGLLPEGRGRSLAILRAEADVVEIVQADPPEDFHPHGIDLWPLDDGRSRLFVVNHRRHSRPTVEVFDLNLTRTPPVATHRRTIADTRLSFPNDVAAVSPDAFFVTNNPVQTDLSQRLAIFLGLAQGELFYFDGDRLHGRAILRFPNGVVYDPERQKLYVAETIGGTVACFDANRLKRASELPAAQVEVGVGLDNLTLTGDGAILATRHVNLLALAAHRRDPPKNRSGWQALRIEHMEVVKTMEDTGEAISGASVTHVFGGAGVVGSVGDSYLLRLTPREPTPPTAFAPAPPP